MEIILDGGVQRGVDIVKGLALGADAVGIGKPYVVNILDVLGTLNILEYIISWLILTFTSSRLAGYYHGTSRRAIFRLTNHHGLSSVDV